MLTRAMDFVGARRDYVTTFVSTIIIQACGVITGILTARLLGPVGKGEVATVLWLPNLMVSVGILGLPQAAAFLVSRQRDRGDALTAVGFWIALASGVVQAAILYLLVPLILGPRAVHLAGISRLFLLYIPVAYFGLTLLGIDQGHQKFGRYNLLRMLPPLLYVFGLVFLILAKNANVTSVLLVNLAAQLIASAIRAWVAGKRLFHVRWPAILEYGRDMFEQGFVFFWPALAGIVLMKTDLALLIHLETSEQLGYYTAAMAIAMGQTGVSTSLIQVSFPKVSSISRPEAVTMLRRHLAKSLAPIAGMALIVALLSPFIIKSLFGPSFLPALPITYVLIAAISIWGIGQVLENGLRAMGYGAPGALANGIGILVLAASSLVLVKPLRGLGMAVSMGLALLTAVGILGICLRRVSLECDLEAVESTHGR
ncbi:MAG TPA: oligosaccharide flippase family protein [Candidatus Aminicenantes bacterium]|nr:oligosaccharide flippase family protein [Candidatus Aminicenantes bacterium]